MRTIERLLDQLNRAYGGPAWHGPAFRELLEGVSDAQANAHPIDGGHSILELVVHVGVWLDAVSERLAGSPRDLTSEEDWSDVTRTSFAAAADELDRAQSRLCDAVARTRPDELDHLVIAKNYTKYVMIHGAIQHMAYHGGQIAILRKL